MITDDASPQQPEHDLETRALALLAQMTLAEKLVNMSGSTPFWSGDRKSVV